jgi:hypothetical protein
MAQSLGDEEKGVGSSPEAQPSSYDIAPGDQIAPIRPASKSGNVISRLNDRLTAMNFLKSRGIERVPLHERHDVKAADYLQMSLLWFSTNITANNMALGMLGPLACWAHSLSRWGLLIPPSVQHLVHYLEPRVLAIWGHLDQLVGIGLW